MDIKQENSFTALGASGLAYKQEGTFVVVSHNSFKMATVLIEEDPALDPFQAFKDTVDRIEGTLLPLIYSRQGS